MQIKDARFVVLDTETTGLDPREDRVVELSLVKVSRRGIVPLFDGLINPQCHIPAEASAIHHITDRHVQGRPTLETVWPVILGLLHSSVVVAHNAVFDRSFLPETGLPWLCSMRLARHLWPEAPRHSNQVLRYWLDLDVDNAGQAHSAVADALVTAHLLQRELAEYHNKIVPLVSGSDSVDALIAYAESPAEIRLMPFGKYRGTPVEQLPMDYIRWALTNVADLDEDLNWSLKNSFRKQFVLLQQKAPVS